MKYKVPIIFLLPALSAYILMRIVPMLLGLFYSFTNWNGYQKYKFVGFENFVRILSDSEVLNSLKVTALFVVVIVVGLNVLGLIIAVTINQAGKMSNVYRCLFFIPVVMSKVAVAFLWKGVYSYNGILNYTANILHLDFLKIGWLTDVNIAIFSCSLVAIWQSLGFHIVILLAALQTIPSEYYEAAKIDGCNIWTKFKHITLPLIIPGLTVSIIMSTIGTLQLFAEPKIMTNGGPISSTMTITLEILREAFEFSRIGYASAIALLLFIAIIFIAGIQNKFLSKKEVEY